MVSMELATRDRDGQVVVALRGELDVADAASVVTALTELAARERQVIVDLEGLEFIDSSGLHALVRAREHVRRAGGDLLLAAPQQQVLRVLALTRLIEVFPVHACVEEAGHRRRFSAAGRSGRGASCHPRGDMIPATPSVPAGQGAAGCGTLGEHRLARAVTWNYRPARAEHGLRADGPALLARDELPARFPRGWGGSHRVRLAGPGKSVRPWENAAARRTARCRSPPAGQQTPRASSRHQAARP